jgi:hypothetical protein
MKILTQSVPVKADLKNSSLKNAIKQLTNNQDFNDYKGSVHISS